MRVAVLNRYPLSETAYADWLAGPGVELHLFTSAEKAAQFGDNSAAWADRFHSIEVIRNYDTSGRVEELVTRAHADRPFDRLVAVAEFDLIRAGRLRDYLGLPGQTEASAVAFRDKLVMKRRASEVGIEVPTFAPVDHPLHLLAFVERYGFPVVVKPRLAAACIGLRVLRQQAELTEFLAVDSGAKAGAPWNYLVERYVDGRMFHIDALVENGAVRYWGAWYYGGAGCVSFKADGVRRAIQAPPGDPLLPRLRDLLNAILAALPTPPVSTYHCEGWLTPNDGLVLCEVASRTGAHSNDVAQAAYGFHPSAEWLRAACGLSPRVREAPAVPNRLSAHAYVYPKGGRLVALPDVDPPTGVFRARFHATVGRVHHPPTSEVDYVADLTVSGTSPDELVAQLVEAEAWFWAHSRWERA